MTSEVKRVPELRFPEYSEEWEKTRLKDISKINPKLMNEFPSEFDYIDLESVYKGKINKVSRVTNENAPSRAQRVAQRGDVFFQTVRPYQQNNFVFLDNRYSTVVSTGYAQIRSNMNSFYIYNLLLTSTFLNKVLINCTGSNYPAINSNDLGNISIRISTNENEKQKIGEFFSKLDQQIELEEQKLEKLEEQKKGYMQKIFSQELRFKDENGNDYPEWKEEKLNNVLEKIIDNRGKTPENNATEIYPILEVNSLGNYYPKYKKVVKFVSEETYKTWFREHLKVNDVLFSTVGNTGIVSLMDNNKAVIAQNIVGLRLNYENEAAFLYYLLSYWENQKKVKQIQMGAVQPSVKVSQFKYLKFFFPVKDEQRKISVFLTKFDKVFENQSNKIEILKERKKGFLQKMFV